MPQTDAYLTDVRIQFEKMKGLAEKAVAQVSDDQLLVRIDDESNSIAVIMRHMAGNLRSRFTEFLSTDGEKPDRNRDGEFELERATRAEILADWESGWNVLSGALAALTPDDLLKDVYIRGERHSVIQALDRQLTHHAYHVGQIVFLAKHLRSRAWQSLSIPRKGR